MDFWSFVTVVLCFIFGIYMLLRSEKELEYLAKVWLFIVGLAVTIIGIGIVNYCVDEKAIKSSSNNIPEYYIEENNNYYKPEYY